MESEGLARMDLSSQFFTDNHQMHKSLNSPLDSPCLTETRKLLESVFWSPTVPSWLRPGKILSKKTFQSESIKVNSKLFHCHFFDSLLSFLTKLASFLETRVSL